MKVGEICLQTNNVIKMAEFYRNILGIKEKCEDEVHQIILAEETMLTIYNDGTAKNNLNQNISIAFTVEDIDSEYEKLKDMGVRVIEEPTARPWGAINMSFYDPDDNVVYFRQIPGK